MILVISHRRSGTHLLIDIIRANFTEIDDYYVSIKELIVKHGDNAINELKNIIENSKKEKIVKCHFQLGTLSKKNQEILDYLLARKNLKILYLKRQFGDVMISMSKCEKLNIKHITDLHKYYVSPVENMYEKHCSKQQHYINHLSSWNYNLINIHTVQFEDIIQNYSQTLKQLESILNKKRNNEKTIDVRFQRYNNNFRYTAVEYNGGRINNNIWYHPPKSNSLKSMNFNELQNCIQCAGIIPIWKTDNGWKTIILYNSDTQSWDISKGLLEINENYLLTAIREYREELGIDFTSKLNDFYSVKRYSYYLPNSIIKKVTLFTVFSKIDQNEITLSNEHSTFKQIDLRDAHKYFIHKEKIDIFNEIHSDLKLMQATTAINARKHNEIKTQSLNYQLQHPSCKIILAGSLSTNDYNHLQSDIDLILLINKIDNYVYHYNRIKSDLKSIGIRSDIGIKSLVKNEEINISDPFFQCINKSSNLELRLTEKELNKQYELFRIIWYRAIRGFISNYSNYKYDCCKGIILLDVLIEREGRFKGYTKLKETLLEEMYDLNARVDCKLEVINCINYKKGIVNSLNLDSIEKFYNLATEKLSFINNLNSPEFIISKFIVDLHLKNRTTTLDSLSNLINNVLGNKMKNVFSKTLTLGYNNLLWVILIELRIHIWRKEILSSIHKYEKYKIQLLKKHKSQHDYTIVLEELENLMQKRNTMPNNI